MTRPEMVEELPKACDVGVKKNAKGVRQTWVGYKLHIDAADGGVPVSCLLTSASLHDSQAAIPLASLTAERVDNLYDLMDAAYDADEIRTYSRELGHTATHRRQSPPLGRTQRGADARSTGAAGHGLRVCRPATLQRAFDCRAGLWTPQGRVRRSSGSRAGACQGIVPSHVWHRGANGQPVDAPVTTAPALIGLAHPDRSAVPPHWRPPGDRSARRSRRRPKAEAEARRIRRALNPRWHVQPGTMRRARLMPLTGGPKSLRVLQEARPLMYLPSKTLGASFCKEFQSPHLELQGVHGISTTTSAGYAGRRSLASQTAVFRRAVHVDERDHSEPHLRCLFPCRNLHEHEKVGMVLPSTLYKVGQVNVCNRPIASSGVDRAEEFPACRRRMPMLKNTRPPTDVAAPLPKRR